MLTLPLSTDNPPQDPALTANTFIKNRTLTDALARLAARASAPVVEAPPAPAESVGVEYYDGKAKPYRAYRICNGVKKYVGYFANESDAWVAVGSPPPAPPPTDAELDEQYLLLAGWERHATAFGVVYLDPYLYGEHTLNHALLVQEGRDVAAHASTYADGPEAAE